MGCPLQHLDVSGSRKRNVRMEGLLPTSEKFLPQWQPHMLDAPPVAGGEQQANGVLLDVEGGWWGSGETLRCGVVVQEELLLLVLGAL